MTSRPPSILYGVLLCLALQLSSLVLTIVLRWQVNVALVGDEAAASLVAVVPSISSHDAAAFDSDLLEATPKGERARFDIDTPSEEDLDEDAEDLDADDDYDDDYEYEDNDTEHEADNVAAAGAAPVGVAGAAQRNADDAHHHRHRSSSNSSTSSATKRATRGHRRHGHARAHRRVVGVNESRLDLQCLGIVHRTRTLLLPNCWLRVVLSAFDDTLLLDAMIAKEALARTQLVVVSFVVGDAVSLDRAELLLSRCASSSPHKRTRAALTSLDWSRFARPPTEWKDIEQCEQHQQVDTHYSATTTTTTTITATTTTTAAGSSGSGGAATPSDASSTSTTRYLGLDVLEIEPITAAEFETVGPAYAGSRALARLRLMCARHLRACSLQAATGNTSRQRCGITSG